MDKFPCKELKLNEFLVLQLFKTKIFTTRKGRGNKFKRGNSVFRNEKNIAPVIEFITSYRLAFEKV